MGLCHPVGTDQAPACYTHTEDSAVMHGPLGVLCPLLLPETHDK